MHKDSWELVLSSLLWKGQPVLEGCTLLTFPHGDFSQYECGFPADTPVKVLCSQAVASPYHCGVVLYQVTAKASAPQVS
jgi:hypothetical protein